MVVDEQVRAADPGEAEALIARVYRRPQVRDTGTPFLFRQTMRGDERANIARFEFSSQADVVVDLEGVVGIGRLSGGSYRAHSNGDEIDPSGPFVLRPGDARCWSSGLDVTVVNLDLSALARYASGPVLAQRIAPLTPELGRHWDRVLTGVERVVNDPETLRNDLVRSTSIDLLLATALAAFGFESAEPRAENALPSSVRRALRFLEENARLPIGLPEIAAAARLSPRGVEAAFRRHLDTTPLAALRRVRLEGARADLLAGRTDAGGVAAVARAWGFAHLGRFAQRYRAAYGELPSRTLEH